MQRPDDRSSTLCKHRAVVLDPRAADWTTQAAWQIKPTQQSNPQLHPSDKSQFPLRLGLCTHRHVWPSPQWVVPKTKGQNLDYYNDINWTQWLLLMSCLTENGQICLTWTTLVKTFPKQRYCLQTADSGRCSRKHLQQTEFKNKPSWVTKIISVIVFGSWAAEQS